MKKWLLLTVVSTVFVACEEKEDDKIYSAQICINKATSSTVDICLAKIAGVNSGQAYVLRCSAEFIRADITTQTIVEAIENIEDNGAGNTDDPTIEFYDRFSFTNTASADTAVTNCTASGSEGLKLLALSAKTATVIKYDILGKLPGQTMSPADIAALDPSTADAADLLAIGNSVIQMQGLACADGGSLKNTEVCDNINNAIAGGGGNAQAIGEAFINQMKNPNN
ncbi:hypothetical protein K2X05_09485 [bacterium]|nr:hypothetical protein [bacterium]